MTTVPHSPPAYRQARSQWVELLRLREIWTSLAISVMWLAVLFDAVFGPSFVSVNASGTNSTTIPSAVFVAFFAFLASGSVAKHAFRRDRQ